MQHHKGYIAFASVCIDSIFEKLRHTFIFTKYHFTGNFKKSITEIFHQKWNLLCINIVYNYGEKT